MSIFGQRQPCKHIEATIAASHETFVAARPVLEVQRYGDLALKLGDVLDNLYIPNVRGGLVAVPKRYRDSDATPIVAFSRSQRLTLGDGFDVMSPRQTTQLARQLEGQGKTPGYAQHIAHSFNDISRGNVPQQQRALGEVGASAMVAACGGSYATRETGSHIWAMRPLIVLAAPDETAPDAPLGLLHEVVHIVQKQEAPRVALESQTLQQYVARNELEAYYVSGAAEAAGGPVVYPTMHTTVERFRATANQGCLDPFDPRIILDSGFTPVTHALMPGAENG